MKIRIYSLLFSIGLLAIISCSKYDVHNNDSTGSKGINLDTLKMAHSMKGWEIYSWQVDNKWYYSVVMGTNMSKSAEVLISKKTRSGFVTKLEGPDSLKLILAKLQENESVIWTGSRTSHVICDDNSKKIFQLPPQSVIDNISAYCSSKNLILMVVE